MAKLYKLTFYVPSESLEEVKEAVFAAGGGKVGNYDRCCWQVKGMGEFRPLEGSDPYLGESGKVEQVEEYRVELICRAEVVESVQSALIAAHPYETPAFDFVRVRVSPLNNR